jgi:pyruvate/2-oxoglutarate dehydrogenase complex dihydrolipoamide acyltransferase (E2) component
MFSKLVVPGPVDDIEEMRVLEWHGDVGRVFAAGELVVELETHKAVVEVRATRAGVLRQIVCAAGTWQKAGLALAIFGDDLTSTLPASPDDLSDWLVAFEIT